MKNSVIELNEINKEEILLDFLRRNVSKYADHVNYYKIVKDYKDEINNYTGDYYLVEYTYAKHGSDYQSGDIEDRKCLISKTEFDNFYENSKVLVKNNQYKFIPDENDKLCFDDKLAIWIFGGTLSFLFILLIFFIILSFVTGRSY